MVTKTVHYTWIALYEYYHLSTVLQNTSHLTARVSGELCMLEGDWGNKDKNLGDSWDFRVN